MLGFTPPSSFALSRSLCHRRRDEEDWPLVLAVSHHYLWERDQRKKEAEVWNRKIQWSLSESGVCVSVSVCVVVAVVVIPGSVHRARGSVGAARALSWPDVASADLSHTPGGGPASVTTTQVCETLQGYSVRITRKNKPTHKKVTRRFPPNYVIFSVIYTKEYMRVNTYLSEHMYIVCTQHSHKQIHATLSSKWTHPYYEN